jgi:hypothetical protein
VNLFLSAISTTEKHTQRGKRREGHLEEKDMSEVVVGKVKRR